MLRSFNVWTVVPSRGSISSKTSANASAAKQDGRNLAWHAGPLDTNPEFQWELRSEASGFILTAPLDSTCGSWVGGMQFFYDSAAVDGRRGENCVAFGIDADELFHGAGITGHKPSLNISKLADGLLL